MNENEDRQTEREREREREVKLKEKYTTDDTKQTRRRRRGDTYLSYHHHTSPTSPYPLPFSLSLSLFFFILPFFSRIILVLKFGFKKRREQGTNQPCCRHWVYFGMLLWDGVVCLCEWLPRGASFPDILHKSRRFHSHDMHRRHRSLPFPHLLLHRALPLLHLRPLVQRSSERSRLSSVEMKYRRGWCLYMPSPL